MPINPTPDLYMAKLMGSDPGQDGWPIQQSIQLAIWSGDPRNIYLRPRHKPKDNILGNLIMSCVGFTDISQYVKTKNTVIHCIY